MRELIERFTYRFQLWQRERHADYSPADPTMRNPLRFIAVFAVASVIFGVAEPFVFHRAFDVVGIIETFVAVVFLTLYQSKSRWAWHLVIAWVPFNLLLYWVLRLSGYARYQPRVHSPGFDLSFVLFDVALFVAVFVWLFRVRDRYFRYIEQAT